MKPTVLRRLRDVRSAAGYRLNAAYQQRCDDFMCLRPIVLVSMSETEDYWNEFISHGEKENVLWEFGSMNIDSIRPTQQGSKETIQYILGLDNSDMKAKYSLPCPS